MNWLDIFSTGFGEKKQWIRGTVWKKESTSGCSTEDIYIFFYFSVAFDVAMRSAFKLQAMRIYFGCFLPFFGLTLHFCSLFLPTCLYFPRRSTFAYSVFFFFFFFTSFPPFRCATYPLTSMSVWKCSIHFILPEISLPRAMAHRSPWKNSTVNYIITF